MAYDIFTIIILIYDIFVSHCAAGVGGWGGGDEVWDRETMFSKLVKAVTLSGGQRIIAVFFLK